jgi:hypothetical protein
MDIFALHKDIAMKYGTDEAIFIHGLYTWIRYHKAAGTHCYDGRTWAYNTMDTFSELFPFFSFKQIRRIIDSLKEAGVLYIGNYNKVQFDRTQWYALDDSIIAIYEHKADTQSDENTQLTFWTNPSAQMGKCNCPNGHDNTCRLTCRLIDNTKETKVLTSRVRTRAHGRVGSGSFPLCFLTKQGF